MFKLSSNLASLMMFLQTQMHATLLKLERLSRHGELSITPVPFTAIEATSWAAKNLTQPVAPTKPHCAVASRHPPVAEVSSAAVKKRLAKQKREAFSENLTQAMEEHQDQLEEIAARHGKKFKDVLCIAGTAGRYGTSCAWNHPCVQ